MSRAQPAMPAREGSGRLRLNDRLVRTKQHQLIAIAQAAGRCELLAVQNDGKVFRVHYHARPVLSDYSASHRDARRISGERLPKLIPSNHHLRAFNGNSTPAFGAFFDEEIEAVLGAAKPLKDRCEAPALP